MISYIQKISFLFRNIIKKEYRLWISHKWKRLMKRLPPCAPSATRITQSTRQLDESGVWSPGSGSLGSNFLASAGKLSTVTYPWRT